MAPLTVDPAALDGAGAAVITVGDGLAAAITGLATALAESSGMAGDDPAGAEVGRSYDSSASKVIEAMVTIRNGLSRLGDGVRMSAHNYALAEAHSDLLGRGNALPAPPVTAPVSAGSPPSSVGTGTDAPPGWGWVAPYIGMIWPTGDSAKMRAAAAAWLTAGTNFGVAEIQGTDGALGPIRAQQIPEGGMIDAAFTDAFESTTRVIGHCQIVADQLSGYADKVDKVHAAILDLLSRICNPLTGLKEVWEFLTADDEDEIKKIARDIRTVVDNFTVEIRALGREIGKVLTDAETVVATMAKYAAKEWDQFLHGTEVGRELNQVGQLFKGVGEEAWDFGADNLRYGLPRAVVDPLGFCHDWGQRLEGMAPLVGQGGDSAPSVGQAWKDFGKGIVHWDEWSKDPAEAAGKSVFDLGSAVVGGKGMSEVGKALRVPHDVKPTELRTGAKLHPAENAPTPATTSLAPGGKPEPAPPGSAAPQSPAESKPPTTGKPAVAEPSEAPVQSSPSKSGDASRPTAAPASGQHAEPGTAPGNSPSSRSAAPHGSKTEAALTHAGELLKSPIDGGPSSGHGAGGSHLGHEPPVDGASHEPGDGRGQHAAQPSGDGNSAGPSGDEWSPGQVSPSDLPEFRQQQLQLAQSPERLMQDLLSHGCPPGIAESALQSPYRSMHLQELVDKYWSPESRTWRWPMHDGFAGGEWEVAHSISKDLWLDRIGEVSQQRGDYMGKIGDSYPQRALAPGTSGDYSIFQGTGKALPPGWELRYGKVADAFGQPGGGFQSVVVDEKGQIVLIKRLIVEGYLSDRSERLH